MAVLRNVKGRQVSLFDQELVRKREENKKYLMELQHDNLVLPYLLEAGLFKRSETPIGIHGGWESPTCELRGHFLGHWLSACAMYYEATGNQVVKARADEVVDTLERCQLDNGGSWVASIPEKYLHWLGNGKPVWAPQYTIHKTFMGLLDMFEKAGNTKALDIADRFGKWFFEWSSGYSREEFQSILDAETGGMLEIWAALYEHTKKPMYMELMQVYYRESLFDGLLEGKDVLTNMHANTSIAEILGAAKAYEVTGVQKWYDIVAAYWKQAVTQKGFYATGGQTCGEVWTPDFKLDKRLGDKNQEHCTVFAMMRLADFMFRHTRESFYMDYWERNLYNGIMAQGYWQGRITNGKKLKHPNQGLLTYFLPLRAGERKAWSTRTDDFFCCHGTLVQANAAHNEGIYYQDDNALYICQYLDTDFAGEIAGSKIEVRQRRDYLNGSKHLFSDSPGKQVITPTTAIYKENPAKIVIDFHVKSSEKKRFSINFRIPWWITGHAKVTIKGEEDIRESKRGEFVQIEREWSDDLVRIELPKGIYTESLAGSTNMVAFMDGPVVLAGLAKKETALYVKKEEPEKSVIPDNEREWGNWMNTYKVKGQDKNVRLLPLYQIGYERYQIYFPLKSI